MSDFRKPKDEEPAMKRCYYTIVGYRIGRGVQEQRQCRRMTSHPSGLCWQHRSDSVTERYTRT